MVFLNSSLYFVGLFLLGMCVFPFCFFLSLILTHLSTFLGYIQVELVTDYGERVRSKNECLFACKLRELGIPYLYEMAVGEQRPDFTIFIGEEMYFVELLGMMDREEYREELEERLERYRRMKIYPGERLVLIDMTEGVDMRHVEEVLRGLCIGKAPPGIEAAYEKRAV